MKLDQEPARRVPAKKQVLDVTALEVFVKGLPSHCCLQPLQEGLESPSLELFSLLFVALKGSTFWKPQNHSTSIKPIV